MFDGLMQLWQAMQQTNGMPADQSASVLAQLGDPNAIAPLFQDASSWSPVVMETDPLLNPMIPGMQAAMAQATGNPVPQVPMGQAAGQGQPVPGAQPGLTAEQYKMLMGQMPDQRGNYQAMSAPGAAVPRGLSGNFAMQQNAPMQAQRKPSLAELIYGRGR